MIAWCLLWMDDVALMSTDPSNLQKMLDVTSDITNQFHIEFGEPKSKILKIGNGKDNPIFNLGQVILKYTDTLGYTNDQN